MMVMRVSVCSSVRVWVCYGASMIFATHRTYFDLTMNNIHPHTHTLTHMHAHAHPHPPTHTALIEKGHCERGWIPRQCVIALDNSDTPSTESQVNPSTTKNESPKAKGQSVGESSKVTLQKRKGSKKAKKSGDKAEQ